VKTGLLLVAFGCIVWADTVPRLFFSKAFPGSTPAFVAIIVDKRGDAEYREAPEESNPLKFQVSETDVAELFGLAEKLDYFRRPLESPLKVAFTGTKIFRYENGTEKGETKFNFSEDPAARALTDWFERISESEQHLIRLERAAKYDKLGVLNALLLVESAMDRKRLVAPQQFLPMLDRINKNQTYLHAARSRAAALAEVIRANK
jgi:hypothetical protein